MSDAEVEQIIDDHYTGEAQTLTDGAEANLLKFKEIEGKLSEAEQARWDEIKKRFNRKKLLGGGEGDPVNRVVAQLSDFKEGLDGIGQALAAGRSDAENGIGGAIRELVNVVQDQGALSLDRASAHQTDIELSSSHAHLQEVAFSLDESSLTVLNTLITSINSLLSRISVNHNDESAQ